MVNKRERLTHYANTRLLKKERDEIEHMAYQLDVSVSQLLRLSALNYGRYLINLRKNSFNPEVAELLSQAKLYLATE